MNKLLLTSGLVLLTLLAAFFFWLNRNTQTKRSTATLHEEKNIVAHENNRQSRDIHSGSSKFQQKEADIEKSAGKLNKPEETSLPYIGNYKNAIKYEYDTDDYVDIERSQKVRMDMIYLNEKENIESKNKNLSGWIFNENGWAVSGISVEAVARSGSGSRQTATTDSEGFFEFSPLMDSTYHVHTYATDQYESAAAMLQAGIQTAVLVVRKKKDSFLSVHGLVASLSGEVLQGVRVEPAGQARHSVYTDKQGRYSLQFSLDRQDEQVMLRFALDGYQEGHLNLIGRQLAGAGATEASIRLEPVAEQVPVNGVVQGRDGQPVKWASVHLHSSGSNRNAQALTDAEGRFAFANIATDDNYRIWVHPQEGYSDYTEENVVVGSGGANFSIVLDQLQYGNLSGWMLDAGGGAVPNFSLWVRTDQESSRHAAMVTGDSRGRFTLNNLPEGSVTLQTRASPDFSFSGIKVVPQENTEVRLVVDTGNYKLEGFVIDGRGQRLALAKVMLTWSMNQDGIRNRSIRETVTDGAGYFLFMQLGAGTHELSISKADCRPLRQEVMVNAESKALVVRLEKNFLQ